MSGDFKYVLNAMVLVSFALLSAGQITLLWVYLKFVKCLPVVNLLMTAGTLLMTFAACTTFYSPVLQYPVFVIPAYLVGAGLLLSGMVGVYRQGDWRKGLVLLLRRRR